MALVFDFDSISGSAPDLFLTFGTAKTHVQSTAEGWTAFDWLSVGLTLQARYLYPLFFLTLHYGRVKSIEDYCL